MGLLSAQMVFDGTMVGTGSLPGSNYTFNETNGLKVGSNLFHSFSAYNIPSGGSATYSGTGISNFLSRVTGGNPSDIQGTISSSVPGANVFLMNPAGVIFGPGASVNVTGAFTATTANQVELSDGKLFTGTAGPSDALLTSAPPAAFGFLGAPAGKVQFASAGTVTISNAASFHAVAGDIDVTSTTLRARGGRVSLISAGSPGRVALDAANPSALPDTSGLSAGGKIRVTGDSPSIQTSDIGLNTGAGKVVIRGGELVLDNSTLECQSRGLGNGKGIDIDVGGQFSMTNSSILADAFSSGNAPPVAVKAGDLVFSGSSTSSHGILSRALSSTGHGATIHLEVAGAASFQGVSVSSKAQGAGNAGAVSVTAGSLALNNAILESVTTSAGNSGGLTVNTTGEVRLENQALLRTTTSGLGNGAPLNVTAGNLIIDGGGVATPLTGIVSQSTRATTGGATGAITVTSTGTISLLRGGLISTNTVNNGSSGKISISGPNLSIDGQGLVTGIATETTGTGHAGDVDVNLTGNLELFERGRISATTLAPGNGGLVTVKANSLVADGRGQDFTGILALAANQSSTSPQQGKGGNISVDIRSISLRNGALIDTSTFGGVGAGDLVVTADTISVDRAGSGLFTGIGSDTDSKDNAAPGGSVTVTTRTLELLNGGNVSTSTFARGDAGNVTVTATGSIHISGAGTLTQPVPTASSGIVAVSKAGSTGKSGSVTVTAPDLRIEDRGVIGAFADGTNDGGTVSVTTTNLTVQNLGAISSRSTGPGMAGGIHIYSDRLTELLNGGAITVESLQTSGGSVVLESGGSVRLRDSAITAQAKVDGGNISISAANLIYLTDSQLLAEAGRDGGNIFLRDALFALLDHSIVSANAIYGNGGYIQVSTDVLLSNNSAITASSQFGADGVVRIDAISELSQTRESLDDSFLNANNQLQERCNAWIPGDRNSFLQLGRGGMPVMPGRFLPAQRLLSLPKGRP